jgi:4-phospho-D-threonate 3-dehydrogenase / 4-phospho-D-erythronate 3-dehydrogenase
MLAVTMGDGNGIGPEIILKTFNEKAIENNYIVVGDIDVLQYCNQLLGYDVPINKVESIDQIDSNQLNIFDMGLLAKDDIDPGKISGKVAAASRAYICKATDMVIEGICSAMVTLPVNKEAIRLSDAEFTGHTELIADICEQSNYTMMLASEKLIVTHVSTHVSLQQAIKNVTTKRVMDVISLTHQALSRYIAEPRIAIAGLNPHAGEGGAFGKEEIEQIQPAIDEANTTGMKVTGPYPPDTVFLRAYKGEFDAVVCMYHDQGHIPMKLLAFDSGVNVTLGLKVMRTSVDHGTGFDIAYTGKASINSYVEAFRFAQRMQNSR